MVERGFIVSDARRLILLGSIFALLSVVIGAFGAHAVKSRLDATGLRGVFETGVQYQMFHSIAILLLASFADRVVSSKRLMNAAILFSVGIILFSGSLYALALSDVKVLGAITPLGGLSFMAGWILVAFAAAKGDK
jgi:uncharacterized membrane protein YgdD (TMEM256/DUF423 family)